MALKINEQLQKQVEEVEQRSKKREQELKQGKGKFNGLTEMFKKS